MSIQETAFQLITALGSLGSLLGGIKALNEMTYEEQREIINEFSNAANYGVIDETLLGNMTNKVKKSVKRLSDSYADPTNNSQDINKEKEIAKFSICLHLKDIKDLNEGELPTEYLKAIWKSFGCAASSRDN